MRALLLCLILLGLSPAALAGLTVDPALVQALPETAKASLAEPTSKLAAAQAEVDAAGAALAQEQAALDSGAGS